MISNYTARLELDTRSADLDRIADALDDYDPVVSRTLQGRPHVHLTVPAEGLRQAITTAMAVAAGATGFDVLAVEVMPTAEFEQRVDVEDVPALLSVSEAATELGVSPQAIRLRLDGGTLAGFKIGSTWAVPRAAVYRLKAAAVPSSDPRTFRVVEQGGELV